MTHVRPFIAVLTIIALLGAPLTAAAQTQFQQNISQTPTSGQVLQQYNPNATLNTGGGTFNGITFSGVGGAIAACTNVGGTLEKWIGSATNSISGLFNSQSSSAGVGQQSAGAGSTVGGAGNIGQGLTVDPNKYLKNITGASGLGAGSQTVPVTDQSTEQQLAQSNKREDCLNGIAYAVAKSMLQQLVNKTLSLVNTGNFGNPYYVRDIGSYLNGISNQEVQKYLNQIPNQNPIFGNAIRSIITEQVTGVQDGLLTQTMNTPQAIAYQNFQNDFSNGGWEAFLDPNNSSFNAVFNAGDQLGKNIATQQQDVQNQLQRNGGFLDMRRCVEYAQTTNTGTGSLTGLAPLATANDSANCLTWETVTPGSVLQQQVSEVTSSPIRQLENADRINEVLGAFFDQMLNNLYSAGLGALRGNSGGTTFSLGSGGANVVIGSNGVAIPVSIQNSLDYSSTSPGGATTTDFDVSRPQQIRTILQVQENYLNRAEDAKAAEARIIPVLGALDYCIPGPNPTWQDGLKDSVSTYTNSLQIPATNGSGSGTGSSIGSGIGAVAGTIIPGIGTAIGSVVGNVLGGLIGGIIDNGKPHGLIAANVSFLDKVTNQQITITDSAWHEVNRSPDAIFSNFQDRLKEVLTTYQTNYTQDNITTAFVNVDSANADFARGFVATAFNETAKLPAYDQALSQIDDDYTTNIANAKAAITELQAIQQQANSIVATAKARYVAQQKAAGTPVSETCLNQAYQIDTTPITVPARVETDTASPYAAQSSAGTVYFYSHL